MQAYQVMVGLLMGVMVILFFMVLFARSKTEARELKPIRVRVDENRRGRLPPAQEDDSALGPDPWEMTAALLFIIMVVALLIYNL